MDEILRSYCNFYFFILQSLDLFISNWRRQQWFEQLMRKCIVEESTCHWLVDNVKKQIKNDYEYVISRQIKIIFIIFFSFLAAEANNPGLSAVVAILYTLQPWTTSSLHTGYLAFNYRIYSPQLHTGYLAFNYRTYSPQLHTGYLAFNYRTYSPQLYIGYLALNYRTYSPQLYIGDLCPVVEG